MTKRLVACYTHLHNRRRAPFESAYAKMTVAFMKVIEQLEEDTQAGVYREGWYNEVCKCLKHHRDQLEIMGTGTTVTLLQ